MNPAHPRWTVKDTLAGDAHISFEGDLRSLQIMQIESASDKETPTLKRNTLWPEQDFVIVPLEPGTARTVLNAIGGNVPRRILHIQIGKSRNLAFAAYDRFHADCMVFGRAVDRSLLDEPLSRGVIASEG